MTQLCYIQPNYDPAWMKFLFYFTRVVGFVHVSAFVCWLFAFCFILNWLGYVVGGGGGGGGHGFLISAEGLRLAVCMFVFQVIFRPPMDVYDLVIHLSPRCLTRGHQGVGAKGVSNLLAAYPRPPSQKNAPKDSKLPVTSFNPAEIFLENLRVSCLGCLF